LFVHRRYRVFEALDIGVFRTRSGHDAKLTWHAGLYLFFSRRSRFLRTLSDHTPRHEFIRTTAAAGAAFAFAPRGGRIASGTAMLMPTQRWKVLMALFGLRRK
jgi:hypothetical protein